ncbi:MAG: glycosyltransferase family 1 protein [Phycisphaerales bacterium]
MAKRTSSARPSHRKKTSKKRTAVRKRSGDVFERLERLARNIWWTWNPDAKRLFESMDPALWRAHTQNPLAVIDELPDWRRETLRTDEAFAEALSAVESHQDEYMRAQTWFDRTTSGKQKKLRVAYYCMEYGLHEHLPLYSGGLGVLAADHLKSASDLGVPLVAIGMLWRYGYYRQELPKDQDVRILYPKYDFEKLPVEDTRKTITVPMGRGSVKAKIWKLQVGRVPLYLLDTDIPENKPADRKLTHHLYGAGVEYRIRQEVLLGVGGLLALEALGISPTVHHLNEGHAAFAGLERLRKLVSSGLSYEKAVEVVRQSTVFTTHTPVPAGNDRFEPALFAKYMKNYEGDLGLKKQELLALGREDESDTQEHFCMTVLALKLAEHCNGVAELHGETSRGMWMRVYNASSTDEVPIGHVTNGVHPETWIADEARPFYDKALRPKWIGAGPDDDWWAKAKRAKPEDIWSLRQLLRRKLIAHLRTSLREQLVYHNEDPQLINELYRTLDEDALTIGFARRFATYKRAPLVFKDAKRLAKIMGDADRPVQLVFAGKAHPADREGNEFVKKILSYTRKAPFRGRVFILQNYDTAIGRLLTQGCDLWLNNPIRPMEASGTSGMKPCLNAGLNFSVLDGWWPEGYNGKNGWAIGDGSVMTSRAKQDKFDAQSIYETLENEIVPAFYDRTKAGVPTKWTKMVAECMASCCAKFSSHRMVADYCSGFYLPAHG